MSSLQYYTYGGTGQVLKDKYHYNQAVRIGNRIECSGQGGLDPQTGAIPKELAAEIDAASALVDRALKATGAQGWNQVFRVNSYHVGLGAETMDAMVRNFRTWMPHHCPVWTCVAVPRLVPDGARVEVEVVAFDGEGSGAVDG
ncbi:uncharacterized protein K452DRAFT_279107 [Aplosporella prunicola CBS 121167]|uniref:Uncharacterized protein n=1 Tax=Aplosporella prunicola CBS 121167 TaxID=1176127 RepID=A0A6A6B0N0_9PEZI|nr:uncharacterized protein K452DRAFT_279107 [Aplosporella prunicola CBS 121167]KAF2137108.1 hypothetical protein K452DRAFT_279107 [Aplosporella prunicola CBS 121167]